MGYRIRKVDNNQHFIVEKFRKLEFTVLILSEMGNGCPDLLISHPFAKGWSALCEIKDGSLPLSKQKLTPLQIRFHAKWSGNLFIIRSESDVEELFKTLSMRG